MLAKSEGRDAAERAEAKAPGARFHRGQAQVPAAETKAEAESADETESPQGGDAETGAAEAKAAEAKAAEAKGPVVRDLLPDGSLQGHGDKPVPDGGGGGDGRLARLRQHPIASAAGAVCLALILGGGYLYWDYAKRFEATDDAFIASRIFAIAPRVSGYITAVPVTDNQHVATGDVIARIDERDYRIALEQARAQVEAAKASILNIDAQIEVQQAQVSASKAQVEQVQATLVFARQQAFRYGDLAQRGAGSVQNAEQFTSSLHQQEAALKNAQSALSAAQRQVDSLRAQRSSAEAALAQANAQRDQAALNLSYTTLTAAQAGRVVNLTAGIGRLAQAGTNISMFVPDEIWVTANYKETQLDLMRPGQPVVMRIDAYPGRDIHGRVASVQPGSGTVFSLLPAQNATGNYVKVVQRVPVKIVMENPPADVAIGPGMSVVPSVRVEQKPSLIERLVGWL